jgi:hypothetical protein
MVRPERIKLAAVLAAVKARPLGVLERDKLCVPAGLDGVCARAAAVIRGRGEGRACGAVEQENVTKKELGRQGVRRDQQWTCLASAVLPPVSTFEPLDLGQN